MNRFVKHATVDAHQRKPRKHIRVDHSLGPCLCGVHRRLASAARRGSNLKGPAAFPNGGHTCPTYPPGSPEPFCFLFASMWVRGTSKWWFACWSPPLTLWKTTKTWATLKQRDTAMYLHVSPPIPGPPSRARGTRLARREGRGLRGRAGSVDIARNAWRTWHLDSEKMAALDLLQLGHFVVSFLSRSSLNCVTTFGCAFFQGTLCWDVLKGKPPQDTTSFLGGNLKKHIHTHTFSNKPLAGSCSHSCQFWEA